MHVYQQDISKMEATLNIPICKLHGSKERLALGMESFLIPVEYQEIHVTMY